MAPSTPPPPNSERLAALTIASTSSVVMSATMISRVVWPTSAVSSLIRASISRGRAFRCRLKVNGGAYPNVVIMRIEEPTCSTPAAGAQHFKEIVVGVEPAGGGQRLRRSSQRNPMHIDPPILPRARTARQLSFVDQFADESEPAQLGHQRRIERDLVDARQDFILRFRNLLALNRINLNQYQIFSLRGADQWIERRVSHVAAVPVTLAVDLDGTKQVRQTGGRDDHVRGHFLAPEDVQLSGLHVGRRHEQLQVLVGLHRFEIDKTTDQVLQRVDVEGIEI